MKLVNKLEQKFATEPRKWVYIFLGVTVWAASAALTVLYYWAKY